jgi:hypothetical protein
VAASLQGSIKRTVIFVHRWLGVLLCLVFLMWFLSGIGMMYWTFPSVTAADRLERSAMLDPSTIRLSPIDAYRTLATVSQPVQVRLNTFDGRPVYRFRTGRDETIVYADTGEPQAAVSKEMMDRIAAAWTGQPASNAIVTPVDEVDQWTVQAPLRTLRPLWKYAWPNGEQVYISQSSGEVVQYTTTASRLGAYVGAIPHWLYFTPLRKRQAEWSAIVIWSSGVATVAAILGLVVGVWMFSPSKRYRRGGVATSVPYRGQKRWHMVLGLLFGAAAVTWAFSGMLSMDPFPVRPAAEQDAQRGIRQAFRGRVELSSFLAKDPRDAIESIPGAGVKDLEFTSFAGTPVYLATLAGGDTRIIPMAGPPQSGIQFEHIVELVRTAAGPEHIAAVSMLEQYDRYYLDRLRQRPLPVVLVQLNDDERSRYYIDPKTGRMVGSYSSANWITRWAYHGLHSFDFPWLYNYRPAWDLVVIGFMLGGTALCITSLVLAWRVVGRTMAGALSGSRAGRASASDDLMIGP